jgi:hypothetical protein
MRRSPDEQETPAATRAVAAVPPSRRSLVLVVGSGRSGTSLFTGILQRLGFHVPQPEVPADDTNPRGFAESQWVVDFHSRLLARAGVQVSDARPGAWAEMAHVALDEGIQRGLRNWLGKQFGSTDDVIIKDPRLSWFLPLWRRCAEDLGLSPRFVTVLRHPAAVVQSKQRSYGTWQGDVARTAGWLNQALFTERATRDAPRAFVRHEELLDDWTQTVGRVADLLDLAAVRNAPAASIVRVHEFVDRSLSQSRAGWGDFEIPAALREQADEVWELMCALAAGDAAVSEAPTDRLEAARAAYVDLYEDAEAIVQSSILAPRRLRAARRRRDVPRLVRLTARVFPKRYRHKVPLRWRRAVFRVLERSGAGGR